MTRPRPYVGITGFTSRSQVSNVFHSIPPPLMLDGHDLMVGVLVSSKTKVSHYPQRIAPIENVADIYGLEIAHQLRLIHYSDHPSELLTGMKEVAELVSFSHDGFQINMAWPDPKALRDYRRFHSAHLNCGDPECMDEVRMVLQIGQNALRQIQCFPDSESTAVKLPNLAKKLKPYCEAEAISDILIDPSGGQGQEFDSCLAQDLLLEVCASYPHLGVGISGGLCQQSMGLVYEMALVPGLSIDAEGRLRDPVSDKLIEKEAAAYLESGLRILKLRHPSRPVC